MEIKPSALLSPALITATGLPGGLSLKLDQLIQAKVVETQLALNSLTLKIDDQTLTLQSNRPFAATAGQLLEIRVDKLSPRLEFKVVSPGVNTDTRLTAFAKSDSLPTGAVKLPETLSAGTHAAPRFSATVISATPTKIVLLPTAPWQATSDNLAPSSAPTSPGASDKVKLLILTPEQLRFDAEASSGALKPASAQRSSAAGQLPPPAPMLRPGMKVVLQALPVGNQPGFAISRPETVDTANAPQIREIRHQLLPQSLPMQPLLQHLAQLTLVNPQIDSRIGDVLRRLAQEILRDLPLKAQLTEAAGLRRGIADSGLFLESKLLALLQGPQTAFDSSQLRQDMKFKFERLAGEIVKLIGLSQSDDKTQPPELSVLKDSLDKIQASLAKQTLDQLNSLPRDDSTRQTWLIELPFHNPPNIDSVSIEIEQDRGKDSDSKPNNWAVSIAINPPDLGTIHCRLSCYDGAINTRFWSESTQTVDKLNSNMAYLKQQFEQKGLVAGFMEAHRGKPAASDANKQTPASILSVKA